MWVVVTGIVAILVGIELAGFRERVPPRSRTNAALVELKALLLDDAAARGEVVGSLAELPGYVADAHPFVDGWSEPVGLAREGDRVVLQSFGSDFEPGGVGQETDMVGVFPLHDRDGRWSAPDVPWLVDPLDPGAAAVLPGR